MRVVVVDDEPLARDLLRRMLAAQPGVELVAEAADADGAVAAIARHQPDVVLLDVQRPGADGFSVLDRLGPAAPAIVFVTAHDRYAVAAFDRHAVDYLLKPFDEERLATALARARARRAEPAVLARAVALLSELGARGKRRLVLRDGERTVLVALDDIECVEAAGKHVEVHAVGPGGAVRHLARDSLAAIEARLDPGCFLRIHRSVVVNLEHVREVRPFFAGDQQLTLTSGRTVTTGRGYRDRLRERLGR